MIVDYNDIELCEYKKAWSLQESEHARILAEKSTQLNPSNIGTLIFCEHPHVFTLGKSGEVDNLLINEDFLKRINATYFKSNRGGDITYHGPGQLVGYPVFDLQRMHLGVKAYIFQLEEAIIQTLAEYGLSGDRLEGSTGVWLDTGTPGVRKICAIGVRVSKAVTMHGFALNVNTDLNYFSYINPCGFTDKGVTSMAKELGRKPEMQEVKYRLREKILSVFELSALQ